MSIQVSSISKIYKHQKVLDAISFSANKGQIIGFLGPNGAGKSTMMKILTGFIKPNEGEVSVNEIDVLQNPLEAQKSIGYLPEHNPLYTDMYVREYLQFQAAIFKVDKSQIETCIEKVGLTTEAHKKINQLSKGYQQRVGLAAAILHNPKVLILDEPTTGLDPNQLVEIRGLIKELGKDKTVLLSTNIMQEVEAICDRIIIIHKGKIVADDTTENIKNRITDKQQKILVEFDKKVDVVEVQKATKAESIKAISENQIEFTAKKDTDIRNAIMQYATSKNLTILSLVKHQKTLEEVFQELTTNNK